MISITPKIRSLLEAMRSESKLKIRLLSLMREIRRKSNMLRGKIPSLLMIDSKEILFSNNT